MKIRTSLYVKASLTHAPTKCNLSGLHAVWHRASSYHEINARTLLTV